MEIQNNTGSVKLIQSKNRLDLALQKFEALIHLVEEKYSSSIEHSEKEVIQKETNGHIFGNRKLRY